MNALWFACVRWGWLWVCVIQLKAPVLLLNRCELKARGIHPKVFWEEENVATERVKNMRRKEKIPWKHICGAQRKADMTQLLTVTELLWHLSFFFFPLARHGIHSWGKKLYNYLSFTLTAASSTSLIEISVHYVLVHCPGVCSDLRDTMSVRQSQWNVDFRLLSTDWCNQVLLTLLISLLTLPLNTSAAPSLHWANTTVLSAHQHVCTKRRVCLHWGSLCVSQKAFLEMWPCQQLCTARISRHLLIQHIWYISELYTKLDCSLCF